MDISNVTLDICHVKHLILDECCQLKDTTCPNKYSEKQFHPNTIFFSKHFLYREYIKVVQRNFRQFLKLRNWGWFSLIQKTRPLVGMVDIEVVIQELESAANEAVADVQNEINEKKRLEDENKRLAVSSI